MNYVDYLQTDEWRELRAAAIERDGGRCRLCNSAGPLHVHHRTYARVRQENVDDLTTLCRECHQQFHKVPKKTAKVSAVEPAPISGVAQWLRVACPRKSCGAPPWDTCHDRNGKPCGPHAARLRKARPWGG